MALIDLKTDLKSLKYGHDRLGGGSSGQPYIQTNINRPGTNLVGNFDDGLVRGGAVGAAKASIVDTLRIGKFLTDFPKGPLFIVKQVGLQLSNPRLEAKQLRTDNPTRGGGLLRNVGNFIANVANKITNLVGPTRLYNLGINTIAQVPVNAFGGHFNRHGILPVQSDDTKYLAVAQYNNNEQSNRLIGYRNKFELGDLKVNASQDRRIINKINSLFSILGAVTGTKMPSIAVNPAQLTIANYFGGPNSVYGIGNTIIKRYDFTEDGSKITPAKEKQYNEEHLPGVKIQNTFDYAISNTTSSLLNKNKYALPTGSKSLYSALDRIASDKDKHGTNTTNQAISYTNASNNLRSGSFTSSPSFISGKKVGLLSLNYTTGSNSDKHSTNFIKQYISYVDANDRLRSGSFTSDPSFISGKGVDKLSLEAKEPYQYKRDHSPVSHEVISSADIGLSSASIDLSGLGININQNAVASILPTNTTSFKYLAIKNQVDNQSIDRKRTYDNGNYILPTFTTAKDVGISRGASDYRYLGGKKILFKFDRTNDRYLDEDTLALIFKPLDPFTGDPLSTLRFLGYLNEYTENYESGWNPITYAGRAESFYTFNSFKRTLAIGFNIPCYNKEELVERHCALSELASSLAGSYNEEGLMGGIITRLKLGGYIDDQPGIINNLSFNPIQDSSWDLDQGLAFYLKVSFGFTVIHDFLPQYKHCGLMIAPPVVPDVVPVDPRPVIPPTPDPPVTVGGGGGIVSSSFTPFSRINMEMLRDDTQLKSNREKNIYGSLAEAKTGGRTSRFGGFGGGSSGGSGASGTWEEDPKFKDKIIARKQAIDKDPKVLLSTQKYYF